MIDTQVLIAGGGPVGLITALELNKQGIKAILIERNPSTTHHPKMDITNGRSMELFRRWGVHHDLRAIAVPEENPFRVIWVSNVAEYELARFEYPTFAAYRKNAKTANNGTHTLEPGMRVSQILVEPCLKNFIKKNCPHIDMRFGWRLETFTQDVEDVTATIKNTATGEQQQIRALYLAGCDGAGSITRRTLGIEYEDIPFTDILKKIGFWNLIKSGVRDIRRGRKPPSEQLYMIHFTSPDLEFFERFGTVWHLQSPNGSVLISQNDKDTWTLHVPMRRGEDPVNFDAKKILFDYIGKEFKCTILQANSWKPRLSVAKKFGKGRVWLAGDAVRQVIPSGGYGMNTGVGDALALGWVLAANIQGWGTPKLFKAYEIERRPVAIRNRDASAEYAVIRIKIGANYVDAIHLDSPKGEKARKKAGADILKKGNVENEAIGIEAGYRYDGSPVICVDGESSPPPFEVDKLQASTFPGLRVPAVWLKDGRAIPDLLSDQFTLIRFADVDISAFEEAAKERGVPLTILDIREERVARIYEKKLVLVRPDQHVAWRADIAPSDALKIIDKVRGG